MNSDTETEIRKLQAASVKNIQELAFLVNELTKRIVAAEAAIEGMAQLRIVGGKDV